MAINLGPITLISDALRDASNDAINGVISGGSSDPEFIIQTADGSSDLITFTLDDAAAFEVSASGQMLLDVDPAITAEASAGGAPGRYVIKDGDGAVHITGEASGDNIVQGLVYAIGSFALMTPAVPPS